MSATDIEIMKQWRRKMFVVFDLDGTLALTEHRSHFLRRPGKDKDWRGFYAACDKDQPCHPFRQNDALRCCNYRETVSGGGSAPTGAPTSERRLARVGGLAR